MINKNGKLLLTKLKSLRNAKILIDVLYSTFLCKKMHVHLDGVKFNKKQNRFKLTIVPRLRSRPNFVPNQTFQSELISDQTFQTENNPDQTFQTQVTSDKTCQTQRVSDQTFQTEFVLIRPSSDHGLDSNLDHCPDPNQTMIRLNCARRGYDQTQLRSKTFLIRPNCARAVYDPTQVGALEYAYNQTYPNWPLTRPTPDHGPDCFSALELPSRPCNFGLGTHGCAFDWVWS